MNKIKELELKLKKLKILLIGIPFIYALLVKVIKKTSRNTKIIIVIISIISSIFYIWIGHEYFETKRELNKIQFIQLKIEPPIIEEEK